MPICLDLYVDSSFSRLRRFFLHATVYSEIASQASMHDRRQWGTWRCGGQAYAHATHAWLSVCREHEFCGICMVNTHCSMRSLSNVPEAFTVWGRQRHQVEHVVLAVLSSGLTCCRRVVWTRGAFVSSCRVVGEIRCVVCTHPQSVTEEILSIMQADKPVSLPSGE